MTYDDVQGGGKRPDRTCYYCGDTEAVLYCRADTAKLCLGCDREVHSTNPLFAKHTRSLLCDACDSSPASIYPRVRASRVVPVLRLGAPRWFMGAGLDEDEDKGGMVLWEMPSFVSLDDLIANSENAGFKGLAHAGGDVPHLPKNRNGTCGQHKKEILHHSPPYSSFEQTVPAKNEFEFLACDDGNGSTPSAIMRQVFQWIHGEHEVAEQDYNCSYFL
ncbi:hypothetical protein MLD38_031786, partial [Melastoma candidum]